MKELRDLMEEQLDVGERRMAGRQEEDDMQVGLESGVESEDDEIEQEGLLPEPGHHEQERFEARREGGRIVPEHVAQCCCVRWGAKSRV